MEEHVRAFLVDIESPDRPRREARQLFRVQHVDGDLLQLRRVRTQRVLQGRGPRCRALPGAPRS